MSESTSSMEQYSLDDFLSAENLDHIDEAVAEVFGMMLGFEVEEISASEGAVPADERKDRTALVGFSGSMLGWCEMRVTSLAAQSIASAMLGSPVGDGDDSIDDAVGELCNISAGCWKNRVPPLASLCALTPPTVISGSDYRGHICGTSIKVSRIYQFGGHKLQLELHREDLAGGPSPKSNFEGDQRDHPLPS